MGKYTVQTGFAKSWNNQYNCYDEHISNENGVEFSNYNDALICFNELANNYEGEPAIIVEILDNENDYDTIKIYQTDPYGNELK